MLNQVLRVVFVLLATYLTSTAQTPVGKTPVPGKEVVTTPKPDSVVAKPEINTSSISDTATKANKPVRIADDAAPVQLRQPNADRLASIQRDREYQYGADVPPTASPWNRFWSWFWYQVNELLRSKAYRNVGQYVLMLAVAGLVVWLLYKADALGNLFPKRARQAGLGYDVLADNIHEINFTDRINEAVEVRNFRLAVRLLYLQSLKNLADGGQISWQPDKTNRHYARELTGTPKRAPFEQLTTQFEYVWYGDFPVDEARYGFIRQQFNQFNQFNQ